MVADKKVEGTLVEKAGPPRSYTAETPKGQLRRNRRHLSGLPEAPNTDTCTTLSSSSPDAQTARSPAPTALATAASMPVTPRRTTQSGREVRPRSVSKTYDCEPKRSSCVMTFQNFDQLIQIFFSL